MQDDDDPRASPAHAVQIPDAAAYLIHDLKNPVNAIELLAQLVLRDPEASARSRAAAEDIRAEVQVLIRLVTSLLDIGRAEHGELVPNARWCDPGELVASAVAELRSHATAAGIVFSTSIDANRIYCDPDLVGRVLANLVENAIRYAPEGTPVEVAACRTTDGVEVRVADAGPGVPVAMREAVFERFVRGDPEATRTNRGMGLTFCRLAARAHGGEVWIEDGNPGAVFCVRIPDPSGAFET